MHYPSGGTSLVKLKEKTATPQNPILLERDLSTIETKRKEFLNCYQKQRLKLQHVKRENARRMSDFNETILNQTILPPLSHKQERQLVNSPELETPNCIHRRSLSKGNILNQDLLSYRKRDRKQDEGKGLCASSGSRLFRRQSEVVASSEKKEKISRCLHCRPSDRRQSKVALTKYQLKRIFVPIDEDEDLLEEKQNIDKIQEMKDNLQQEKQILHGKIQSWFKDFK